MSYVTDVANLLTDQLARFITLNRHQLVGHVANLDFWLNEVKHALAVIDDYKPRFERLQAAQQEYMVRHQTIVYDLEGGDLDERPRKLPGKPLKRLSHHELQEARRSLCDTTYRLLVWCYDDEFVDEARLREACRVLDIGVDADDLRRNK